MELLSEKFKSRLFSLQHLPGMQSGLLALEAGKYCQMLPFSVWAWESCERSCFFYLCQLDL